MGVIYIMWLRELKRYFRSRAQIVASLGQPMLYLIGMGFGMSPIFAKAGQGSYIQFVSPGIISMAILFSSIFSGMGLLWDRQFGFLRETLVAPVPRWHIMLGRTLGAATVSVMQGTLVLLVCVIAGFRIHDWTGTPIAVLFMLLIASVFASMGTAIGSALTNIQGFQFMMGFLVMPIFFLSGALYPLENLPIGMKIATRLDPLSYGVDGLRTALIARPHFSFQTDVLVLVAAAIVFLSICTHLFSKIEV